MSDSTTQDGMLATDGSLPLACSLTGVDLRKRGEVIGELFQHVSQVRELPDGYAFTFSGGDDWMRAVTEFIVEERACCPFFTFELASASPHETLALVIRGGGGAKAMAVPFVEKVATHDAAAQ